MLKISSKIKHAQNPTWMDEIQDVDWGEDENEETPINESNYEDYLVDEIEDEDFDEIFMTDPKHKEPVNKKYLGIQNDSKEIEYQDGKSLVYDGIDNVEVISFDYTNRHGMYSGYRTVEPHYTFVAESTGNEVLVSFDREVGDIRAFILSNIHPFGKRYKNTTFEPRSEIMVGIL